MVAHDTHSKWSIYHLTINLLYLLFKYKIADRYVTKRRYFVKYNSEFWYNRYPIRRRQIRYIRAGLKWQRWTMSWVYVCDMGRLCSKLCDIHASIIHLSTFVFSNSRPELASMATCWKGLPFVLEWIVNWLIVNMAECCLVYRSRYVTHSGGPRGLTIECMHVSPGLYHRLKHIHNSSQINLKLIAELSVESIHWPELQKRTA